MYFWRISLDGWLVPCFGITAAYTYRPGSLSTNCKVFFDRLTNLCPFRLMSVFCLQPYRTAISWIIRRFFQPDTLTALTRTELVPGTSGGSASGAFARPYSVVSRAEPPCFSVPQHCGNGCPNCFLIWSYLPPSWPLVNFRRLWTALTSTRSHFLRGVSWVPSAEKTKTWQSSEVEPVNRRHLATIPRWFLPWHTCEIKELVLCLGNFQMKGIAYTVTYGTEEPDEIPSRSINDRSDRWIIVSGMLLSVMGNAPAFEVNTSVSAIVLTFPEEGSALMAPHQDRLLM